MACNETTSNLCIEPINAQCVDYEGPLGENTTIETTCVTQEQVNEDLYDITDGIISSLETPTGESCIVYPTVGGEVTPQTVMAKHRDEICLLKTAVEVLENKDYAELDITGFALDFGCLSDPCGDPITKLGVLLQLLINKACV